MGTKRPHCRRDWDADLKQIGNKVGFEVVTWNPFPAKRSKVLIRCAHGEKWVFPQGQLNKDHCCKSASKRGEFNPFYNKPTWNTGTTGISTGHGIGYNIDWDQRNRIDTLYFVIVADVCGKLHYKIGRSFYGPSQRLQRSLVEVISTWEGPHWQIWWAERCLLERYSGSRSSPTPTLSSSGGTECFSNLNPDEVLKLAKTLL